MRDRTIENDIAAEWEAAYSWSELFSEAAGIRVVAEVFYGGVKLVDEAVRVGNAVVSDVVPDFDQIPGCARADAQLEHLYFGLAYASCVFDFFGVESFGGAAIQAFLDVATKISEFEDAKLIFLFEEAQGFADDFAGGIVGAGGDLGANHLFEMRGEANVHGHRESPWATANRRIR